MNVRNSHIDRVGLQDIESVANRARQIAQDRLAYVGLQLDRTTDIRVIAAVLTGGPVEARSNLWREGRRLAGVLEWESTWPTILFEAFDPQARQRFSIAHELGHFYLHTLQSQRVRHHCFQSGIDPEDQLVVERQLDVDQEQAADAFAGIFLMPTDDLIADLLHFGCCVAFLAERYQVSEAAMRRRIQIVESMKS